MYPCTSCSFLHFWTISPFSNLPFLPWSFFHDKYNIWSISQGFIISWIINHYTIINKFVKRKPYLIRNNKLNSCIFDIESPFFYLYKREEQRKSKWKEEKELNWIIIIVFPASLAPTESSVAITTAQCQSRSSTLTLE